MSDVVASGANLVDGAALGVLEVPVEVALAGDEGALVAAAHGDDDVGLLSQLASQELWPAIGQVDVELAHDLDNLGMHAVAGRGTSRQRLVSSVGGALEQGLAHLRAASVVEADEQNGAHRGNRRTTGTWKRRLCMGDFVTAGDRCG